MTVTRAMPLMLVLLALILSACGSTRAKTDTPEELHEAWQAFLRDDPGWPELRESWHQRTEADRYQLAEALFFMLITSDEPVDPESTQLWQRAAWELRLLGSEGRIFLLAALRVQVDREPRDWVAIDRTATVLADLRATPELAAILSQPDQESVELRRAATRSLCLMSDRESIAPLVRALLEDPEWSIRARCAEGLGAYPSEPEARDGLVQGLKDSDGLVREKCAGSLARMRNPAVQRALVTCLARALEQGDRRTAMASHDALCTNTGRVMPQSTTPEEWLKVIEERGS